MNKTPRLGKSGIDYLDYAWNFNSGCYNWRNGTCQVGENCWAKKRTHRFKAIYPNGFEPTFYPEAFVSPVHLKKPSIIGCAFMGDLFGAWVDPEQKIRADMPSGVASIAMSLKGWIFTTIRQCPQHTFLFLTKTPGRLISWGKFPSNCWVGVTATDTKMALEACLKLGDIEASVRYLSIEPMLNQINLPPEHLKVCKIGWVIIGLQTPYSNKTAPKMVWIDEIVGACDKASIPIFLKNNLQPLIDEVFTGARVHSSPILTKENKLRQELP